MVFKNIAQTGPVVTEADVKEDIAYANARLAQAGIVLKVLEIDLGLNNTGRARTAALANGWDPTRGKGTSDLIAMKDNDADSIDVFYVEKIIRPDGDKQPAFSVPFFLFRDEKKTNFIGIETGPDQRKDANGRPSDDPFVLPHEIMHILLNARHREREAATSLFNVIPNSGAVVGAPKRIGENLDTIGAGVGSSDTINLRKTAEDLWK